MFINKKSEKKIIKSSYTQIIKIKKIFFSLTKGFENSECRKYISHLVNLNLIFQKS